MIVIIIMIVRACGCEHVKFHWLLNLVTATSSHVRTNELHNETNGVYVPIRF